ncbi:MAG: imidazole glycerol phosphate synthase subunit HisH [Verrucomicrobiae bacterium]|nr:imidazole glycerol phosphate synthase subunit HisH [Verrucomicrobiae bacterium]
MIALVDYGMGNLRSVEKALQRVGGKVRAVRDAGGVAAAQRLVLPGVGAFGDCMKNLAAQGLVESIRDFVRSGRPFLGICLGYQLLFEESEETAGCAGLGLLPGNVIRFPAGLPLKVPQIGWNNLRFRRPDCPLLRGVPDGSHVYFVHSYFPCPAEASDVCTETDYGMPFASMVWRGRMFACQFHPEKSQDVGLKMLENFVQL